MAFRLRILFLIPVAISFLSISLGENPTPVEQAKALKASGDQEFESLDQSITQIVLHAFLG